MDEPRTRNGYVVTFVNNTMGAGSLLREVASWTALAAFCPMGFGLLAIWETAIDPKLLRLAVLLTVIALGWGCACSYVLGPFYLVVQAVLTMAVMLDYFRPWE